jgi:alkanesulfonate monooxygenase SsuD/methylene tetrahydromethanopterin reductase-like flavin-dependent oxidoreductase (luciferase family)
MTMKTMLMNSSAIPATPRERRERRPIGRDIPAFREMLRGYEQIAIWADELGYDAFGSTEHHFQIEGGESIPNNLLLYAKLAALTSQIMFVPCSVVVTSHDPIRVAEDLALFTHMFPGRLGVAFARGFQTRWLQTLSQSDQIASHDPRSDALNREKFDEYLSIIEKAWTHDSFSHDGAFYQAPYPATGIPNWPLADWTRAYGNPGDVDEDGTIHKIGITPKPLERPPIFIPSTRSEQTIIDSAKHGRTIMIAAAGRERIRQVAELYRGAARDAGRDLRLGENIGVVVKIALGDTFGEAFDLATQTAGFWYQNIFGKFFFNEGYRTADDPPARPLQLEDERALMQRMHDAGQLLCGTTEQVCEQMQSLADVFEDGRLDWVMWEYWTQSMPFDDWDAVQREQLTAYAEHVMPNFR